MSICNPLPEGPAARQAKPVQAGLRTVACLTLFAALCLAVAPAQAQWKWRDKDGRITVSDRPPPRDVPERDILAKPTVDNRRVAAAQAGASAASGVEGVAPAAATAAPTAMEREVQSRKKAAEQEQTAKAKAEEEKLAVQRADNCRAARSHLAALEGGQRIARTNDKGEREVLDDKGRADEMRRAREVMTSDCR
jgi:hypothetical protein